MIIYYYSTIISSKYSLCIFKIYLRYSHIGINIKCKLEIVFTIGN